MTFHTYLYHGVLILNPFFFPLIKQNKMDTNEFQEKFRLWSFSLKSLFH
jgi:hypothetical protein